MMRSSMPINCSSYLLYILFLIFFLFSFVNVSSINLIDPNNPSSINETEATAPLNNLETTPSPDDTLSVTVSSSGGFLDKISSGFTKAGNWVSGLLGGSSTSDPVSVNSLNDKRTAARIDLAKSPVAYRGVYNPSSSDESDKALVAWIQKNSGLFTAEEIQSIEDDELSGFSISNILKSSVDASLEASAATESGLSKEDVEKAMVEYSKNAERWDSAEYHNTDIFGKELTNFVDTHKNAFTASQIKSFDSWGQQEGDDIYSILEDNLKEAKDDSVIGQIKNFFSGGSSAKKSSSGGASIDTTSKLKFAAGLTAFIFSGKCLYGIFLGFFIWLIGFLFGWVIWLFSKLGVDMDEYIDERSNARKLFNMGLLKALIWCEVFWILFVFLKDLAGWLFYLPALYWLVITIVNIARFRRVNAPLYSSLLIVPMTFYYSVSNVKGIMGSFFLSDIKLAFIQAFLIIGTNFLASILDWLFDLIWKFYQSRKGVSAESKEGIEKTVENVALGTKFLGEAGKKIRKTLK